MVRRGGISLFNSWTRAVAGCTTVSLVATVALAGPAVARPDEPGPVKPPAVSPGPSVDGVKPLRARVGTLGAEVRGPRWLERTVGDPTR